MKNKMGKFIWYFHREKWIWNYVNVLAHEKTNTENKPFNSPIFMVGLQGAGETLLGRIIKHSPEIVTVGGDNKYWYGTDEMHTVLGPILVQEFTGQLHKVPRKDLYGRRRGWVYASNEMVNYYRLSENTVTKDISNNFRRALRTIEVFGKQGHCRIFDKSQTYALKINAIRKILHDSNPKFLAVLRNPVASIYRAAFVTTHLSKENMNQEDKVRVAAEHWKNTIQSISDSVPVKGEDLLVLKIEDFLSDPEILVNDIFKHINLSYDHTFFPSEKDSAPWWAKRADRWYPLRKNINEKYLNAAPKWVYRIVDKICEEQISWAGYNL